MNMTRMGASSLDAASANRANAARRRAWRTVAIVLTFALAGCGGTDRATGDEASPDTAEAVAQATSETASSPMPDACALVNAERAQVVLGQPVGQMSDDRENCIWSSQGHPGQIAMLMVQLSEEASVDEARTMYDAMVNASGGIEAALNATAGETIASGHSDDASGSQGLGDAAWRNFGRTDAVATRQILVRKGRRILNLSVTGMGRNDGLEKRLEAAARDAVAQL